MILRSRFVNQLRWSTLTSIKLRAVLATASMSAPAPKAAVPPSVLHARFRFTAKPQMKRAVVKRRVRVELQMLRTMTPTWTVLAEDERDAKVMADEARAMGPVWNRSERLSHQRMTTNSPRGKRKRKVGAPRRLKMRRASRAEG
jgi:hypothetical protein